MQKVYSWNFLFRKFGQELIFKFWIWIETKEKVINLEYEVLEFSKKLLSVSVL